MLKKRNDGDLPGPFEGIVEEPITRSRVIKLFGATIAGGTLMAIWPAEADARKRKRRRRRRKARVANSSTTPTALTPAPGGGGGVANPTINITNPSPDKPLTISEVKVIDSNGSVISIQPLVGGPVTIQPGQTLPVTVDLSGLSVTELLDADGLRLVDGRGLGITVIDEKGVQVGDIPIDVSALIQ